MTQTDDPATPAREETLRAAAEKVLDAWDHQGTEAAVWAVHMDLRHALAASVPPRQDPIGDDALRAAAKRVADFRPSPDALMDSTPAGQELRDWWFEWVAVRDNLRAALATPAAAVREAGLDATPAREETLRAVFEAADAFIDELDAPPGHPLSDHYGSQAEARLRQAIADHRGA